MASPSEAEFQDPLENFESPRFADAIEQALHDETVSSMHSTPFATITADTSIEAAIAKLTGDHIACVLVVDDSRLVGVFSDRDVLDKVALDFDELRNHPVSEVMSTNPVFVRDSDPAGAVFSVMAMSGYRHVPIVDADHKPVGIVSPQRANEFLCDHRG